MSSTNEPQTTIPATEPKVEVTNNTKPTTTPDDLEEEIESIRQKPQRKDSTDSDTSVDSEVPRRPRPARRGRPRQYSPSPVRIFNRPQPVPVTPLLSSSTELLEQVNHDGIADLPFPGRSSVYMTQFPYTEKDVKKWAWLFSHGVEDVFLNDGTDEDDEDESDYERYPVRGRRARPFNRRYRNRSPEVYNVAHPIDIPSVYLSRALDTEVVPEDTKESVKYMIVVKSRIRPNGGVKLLSVESRKAAGIAIYYEALMGNSIVFVGATAGPTGKKMKKFKKVDGIEEAKATAEDGVVGIIC